MLNRSKDLKVQMKTGISNLSMKAAKVHTQIWAWDQLRNFQFQLYSSKSPQNYLNQL